MIPRFIGVYGETCAGKSTLGHYLSATMGCHYVSFGDLKRDEVAKRTEVGVRIESLLRMGIPIPAELGYKVIRDSIQPCLNIISGYPISLDEFDMITSDCPMEAVIVLQVSEAELVFRFTHRRECPICHQLGLEGDVCPTHKTRMIRRLDTTEEELKVRRVLYKQRISAFLGLPPISQLPRLTLETSRMTREDVGRQAESWIEQLLRPG